MQRELVEQYRNEERKVRTKAEEMIQEVRRQEKILLDELNKLYKPKGEAARVDIEESELNHGIIISVKNYIVTLMHHGNEMHLLSTKGDVDSRAKQLIASETKPQTQHDVVIFEPSETFQQSELLGTLKSNICISNCTVEHFPKPIMKGDSVNVVIKTMDSTRNQVIPTEPVIGRVRKPDKSLEDIDVFDNRDGTHNVLLNGQMEGKYELTLTVGGQQIPGCPVVITVVKGLVNTVHGTAIEDIKFNCPMSVAKNRRGEPVIADTENHRLITIGNSNLQKIKTFTKFHRPFRPRDIAIASDNTHYTLDSNNTQVVASDEDGNVLRCFGQNELRNPYGIAVNPINGNVYVTDRRKGCVKIYTKLGKYLRSFGSEGSGEGQFNWPWGIVVGSTGMVFVADYNNQRIQVFDSRDKYLYSFDCESGDGQLRAPKGISLEGDRYVYVSANPEFLLQFDMSGQLVCRCESGVGLLNQPAGIAVTDDVPCRVVVADSYNNCIRVFVL
ncbi:tripartite motif-containing protein 2-like [Ptychodera flava]|uniref:tripartite motif-containing protein 2-like n=1 Tax=Ptychodera flava TaxID=63121 RepID=UPI00396AAA4E